MIATVTYRGRTYKAVAVSGITNETHEQIMDAACKVAGERWRGPGRSLFGYKCERYSDDPTRAAVTLDTD